MSTISASTTTTTAYKVTADTTGTLVLQTGATPTTAMTIDTSQNVGIGTASPSRKLDVVSTTATSPRITGSSGEGAYLDFHNNATTTGRFRAGQGYGTASDGIGFLNNEANAALVFGTNNTERMRIDSSGNLLVGTTSTYTNTAKFNVIQPTSSNTAAAIATTYASDAGQAALYIGKYDNVSSTGQLFIRFQVNNTGSGCGQINGNGAGAAAFGSYSDERLKENIVDLEPQLANITALRPVEFDYKNGSGHQTGFIAQEMQQVYSDCVGEDADGMLTITGWSKTEARLVKAIQEQQALITTLTERITALEAK